MKGDFAEHAPRFVKSSVSFAVTVGLAFAGWYVGGDVAVTVGFACQAVASKLISVISFSKNCDFGGSECAQKVSKSPHACGVVQS